MRPINTAEDLFRWFEEVGAKVIPPDDVASQAKLVRDALKRLLAAPAQTMAPRTKDAHLNELLARAKARGPMTKEERDAQRDGYVRAEMSWGDEGTRVVSPTPPADDSAVQRDARDILIEQLERSGIPEAVRRGREDPVQRVVEAARVFCEAWKDPKNGLANKERVALFAALDALPPERPTMADVTTREGRAEITPERRTELRAVFSLAPEDHWRVSGIGFLFGDLRALLAAADERDLLRAALANEAIRMEYDYPGDAPEECGLWCYQCNEHVEENGSGHAPSCLLVGCALAAKEPRRPIVSTPSKRRRKRGDVQAALSPSGDTPTGAEGER